MAGAIMTAALFMVVLPGVLGVLSWRGLVSFASLGALWWLWVLPAIVLIYFLRLKRRSLLVSSTLLWRQAIEDLRADRPFQMLRKNILLFLQLAAASGLVLALSNPGALFREPTGSYKLVLIDRSASMSTEDASEKSRLEAAKGCARELVASLAPADQASLIAFDTTAQVLCSFSSVKSELRAAIDSVEQSWGRTDIHQALNVAKGVIRTLKAASDCELVVISDGAFPAPTSFKWTEGIEELKNIEDIPRGAPELVKAPGKITFLAVGEGSPNRAITAVGSGAEEVFCRATNFSAEKFEGTLEARSGGRLVEAREIKLEARASQTLVLRAGHAGEGVELRLTPLDAMPIDNVAYAAPAGASKRKALLATKSNRFLERALRSCAGVELFVSESAGAAGGYDLVVLDGLPPPSPLPCPHLLINSLPPGAAGQGKLADQEMIDWDSTHPLLRFVEPSGLFVSKARKVKWPAGAVSLMESPEGALAAALSRGRESWVALAFDVYDTNAWPLELSFPLFVANSVDWLTSTSRSEFRTGDVLSVRGPEGPPVKVLLPDGSAKEARFIGGLAHFAASGLPGFHRFVWEEGSKLAAVNLASPDESDNSPSPGIEIAGQEHRAVGAGELRTRRDLWPFLLAAALAVLVVEWYIYNRKAWL